MSTNVPSEVISTTPRRRPRSAKLWRLAPALLHKAGYRPAHPTLYRLWNFSIAATLIVLLSPLFAAIAIFLIVSQGRNILYRGERLGKDRCPFQIYKFRTLRNGVDKVTPPEGLLGTTGLETRLGRYLRKTRLDELPQLFNVLKGDMNLMGPRPVRFETAATFGTKLPGYDVRFSVKPGLVGYTQALMTHDTPKEIRQRFNLLICRRPANIRLEVLFLVHTAVAMTVQTLAIALRRLLQIRSARYGERRRRSRVRPNSAVAIMRKGGTIVGCGYIVDMSEEAFVFTSPVPLPPGHFSFRLICPVNFYGRRSATCDGACREVRRRNAHRSWKGDYSYLVQFCPSSPVSHYIIDRYFLRNSVVFSTGRLGWATSLMTGLMIDAFSAACILTALTVTCSQAFADSYVRPFGQDAPWNIPASDFPRHAQSRELSALFWAGASSRAGDFNLSFDDYTYPVYDAGKATKQYPIITARRSNLNRKTIPWNPAWRPAEGSDAQVIILDPNTGREWDLWQVTFDGHTVRATNGNLVPGDFRTKTDGFSPSRGCGIQYLAMLVRPQEIAQGAIKHALSMPIRNIDGTIFVPPATKLERAHGGPGIPLGTHFALELTTNELEQWIASLPSALPDTTKHSARIIAQALRDYGWFITDTSGSAHLQFESHLSAGERWTALGLDHRVVAGKEYPRDLLDGLIKPERIYALAPIQ